MKYIVFDLDDTILGADSDVSDYTLSVLRSLKEDGHIIIINTARSKIFQERVFARIKPDYSIINGGASVLDRKGEMIFKRHIPKETINRILPQLLKTCRTVSVQTPNISYSNETNMRRPDLLQADFSSFVCDEDVEKIVFSGGCDEIIDDIIKENGLCLTSYFGGNYKRVNLAGATKANTMLTLVEMLGGRSEDIIAFGDDNGDIDMILAAGMGVIMKNAKDELKRICPYVTDHTNADDGVARYLEKILLDK